MYYRMVWQFACIRMTEMAGPRADDASSSESATLSAS
jgi:hypothetical protein